MTKDYESDGRTKLLSSRPEQDNYVGKTLVLALFPATARWCRGRKWSVAERFVTYSVRFVWKDRLMCVAVEYTLLFRNLTITAFQKKYIFAIANGKLNG